MILTHPIPGAPFGDGFGPRDPIATTGGTSGDHHNGQDIVAREGTPILAAAAGRVSVSGRVGTYGYVVYIEHEDGLQSRYAHQIAPPPVVTGEYVVQGQIIGYVGMTGATDGPHLHFETRIDGNPVDPMPLLELSKALEPMSALIREPNGTIHFVSDSGMMDTLTDLEEAEAIKAAGVSKQWVQLPDPKVAQLLGRRTERLRAAEAQRIAAAIKATA